MYDRANAVFVDQWLARRTATVDLDPATAAELQALITTLDPAQLRKLASSLWDRANRLDAEQNTEHAVATSRADVEDHLQ